MDIFYYLNIKMVIFQITWGFRNTPLGSHSKTSNRK